MAAPQSMSKVNCSVSQNYLSSSVLDSITTSVRCHGHLISLRPSLKWPANFLPKIFPDHRLLAFLPIVLSSENVGCELPSPCTHGETHCLKTMCPLSVSELHRHMNRPHNWETAMDILALSFQEVKQRSARLLMSPDHRGRSVLRNAPGLRRY